MGKPLMSAKDIVADSRDGWQFTAYTYRRRGGGVCVSEVTATKESRESLAGYSFMPGCDGVRQSAMRVLFNTVKRTLGVENKVWDKGWKCWRYAFKGAVNE